MVATTAEDVEAAQRLRHQVFADEMGARLHTTRTGLDIDPFDEHCDHLVVRDDRTGETVGTYRMLPPHRAAAAGGLYADGEFDLTSLAPLREMLVETGRSCVHRRSPQRRGHQSHVDGHRPLPTPARSPLAGRLCLGAAGLVGARSGPGADGRMRVGRGRVGDRLGQAPVTAAAAGDAASPVPPRRRAHGEIAPNCSRLCPRSCVVICVWAPGSAASRPTIPTSTSRTSSCCSRSTGWIRATCGTFSKLARETTQSFSARLRDGVRPIVTVRPRLPAAARHGATSFGGRCAPPG